MHVVSEPSALADLSRSWQSRGLLVALVPTMGALHEGHASLIRAASSRADRTIVSIFVNPIQFDDKRDYETYPDTFDEDRRLCERLGVDAVYRPAPEAMYPSGFATGVSVRGLTDRWEGADRPGHFDGVTTVVAKLFLASRADVAVFGAKDFQQAAVVRRMAVDLDVPIQVVVCPTTRDPDGLALSSRNRRLDAAARLRALAIPHALDEMETSVVSGVVECTRLIAAARTRLEGSGLAVHYVAIVDSVSLEPLDRVADGSVALVAASCDGVRLIDNRMLSLSPGGNIG